MEVVAIGDNPFFFFFRKLKHKISRKSIDIPFYLFIQAPGFNAIQFSKIPIKHNLFTPDV